MAVIAAQPKYLVVIEAGTESYGAYVPDLPGCVAVGETPEEVRRLIREAIERHLEALREHGEAIPPPSSTALTVQVSGAG